MKAFVIGLAWLSGAHGMAHGDRIRHPAGVPAWLDLSLAGYALAYDRTHSVLAVRDPVTRFWILRYVECDGADLQLLLTRDRREVDNLLQGGKDESGQSVRVKPLPSLRTGKGISIGDSPERTVEILGPPAKKKPYGPYNAFTYHWVDRRGVIDGHKGAVYEETYTFRGRHLVQVNFFRDESA